MIKKYTSKSEIALSVVVGGKKSAHISFDALTGGGSVYYTSDESLQKALERHAKYGRLFKEDRQFAVKQEALAAKATSTEVAEEPIPEESGLQLQQIQANSLDDAKNYLCDHYNYSRTKLRSKKAIEEAAAERGIEFTGAPFEKEAAQ